MGDDGGRPTTDDRPRMGQKQEGGEAGRVSMKVEVELTDTLMAWTGEFHVQSGDG